MFYSETKKMWIARVDDGTGKKKEISAKTQAALEKKLLAFNVTATNGRTFAECAEGWEKAHYPKIEEKTAISYKPHVKRAKDFFDGRYIKDITPDEIQAYVDDLVAHDMAKDTVRRGLVVVNRIFKWAITQPGSIVRFNPCACVEVPRGLKQTKREPPTEAQIAVIKPDCEMGLFAYFLLCTGLRPCELLALEWKDIDREKKEIHIRKSATYATNKAVVKNRTKSDAGMRIVPLLDALDAVLPTGKTGYVFGGSEPYDKNTLYREWTRWCSSIGLAEKEVTVHTAKNKHRYEKTVWKPLVTPYQFRHEFASMLEDEGVSEFDAQHVMGHSSIVITKDKYTHFREKKHKSEVAEKLNARFSGVE